MGFQFRPKLAAVLAVLDGTSVGFAYIVSQGNITATTVWFAITTGVTAELSYYKEQQQTRAQRFLQDLRQRKSIMNMCAHLKMYKRECIL